jgi:chromate transporter
MGDPIFEAPEKQYIRADLVISVAQMYLKLGLTAFGGPAAYIAMMHEEVVVRHKWVDEQRFLDLLGAANMLPGPTATELAIYIGFQRAGWPGLVLGGVCFILPAMLITIALAWAYVRYGTAPQVSWLLYGIKPVIIAVILQALWGLGRKAVKNWWSAAVGALVFGLYLLGVNVLLLLFGGGMFVAVIAGARRWRQGSLPGFFWLPALGGIAVAAAPYSISLLFLTFLKIGAVIYGSGYVLLAFLRADFVEKLGWLTDQQLMDAVAFGQFTPGPVFSTATFIGYLLGGVSGALAATAAIFLPSFVFVAVSGPLIVRMRRSQWTGAFLDGVNVAALGLMAAVTVQLAQAAIVDAYTLLLAVVAGVVLLRWRVNSIWLILGGAAAGLIKAFM